MFPIVNNREIRNEKRSLVLFRLENEALKKSRAAEIAASRIDKRIEAENIRADEAGKALKLREDAAMKFLHKRNTQGNPHKNFHGFEEAVKLFGIPSSTLKNQYTIYRQKTLAMNFQHAASSQPSGRISLQPIQEIPQPEVQEPHELLESLVNRCLNGERRSVVWEQYKDQLQPTFGKTTFYETVRRLSNDPSAPLIPKKGRGDVIEAALISYVASDRSKDLQGW